MGLEQFIDEAILFQDFYSWPDPDIDADPSAIHPGDNILQALPALLKNSSGRLVICIHGGSEGWYPAYLRPLKPESGASPTLNMIFACATPGLFDRLARLLQSHQVRAYCVILDRSLPLAECPAWCSDARRMLAPDGILFGAHQMAPLRDALALDAARHHCYDLTLGSDYWFVSLGREVRAFYPGHLFGTVKTVKFGSLEEDLVGIPSKDLFLTLSQAGIACHYPVNGNQKFTSLLPTTLQAERYDLIPGTFYWPPYESEGLSEGGNLFFTRNVRMQGTRGFLYSSYDTLLDESMGMATMRREHCRSAEFRALMPGFEPLLRRTKAEYPGGEIEVLTTLFPREIEIAEDVVIVMAPHLENYMHWMYTLLPKFWYLDQFPQLAKLPIVMSPIHTHYQKEFLEMLGIAEDHRFIFHDMSVSYKLNRAYLPTIYDRPVIAPANISWLREKFLPHAAPVPEGYENGLYYITRIKAASRTLVNDEEVRAFLQPLGFKIVDWSDFTARQQIALAQHAKMIIVPHGAPLANLVFCSAGSSQLFYMRKGAGIFGVDWSTFIGPNLGVKVYAIQTQGLENNLHSQEFMDMAIFKATVMKMFDDRR